MKNLICISDHLRGVPLAPSFDCENEVSNRFDDDKDFLENDERELKLGNTQDFQKDGYEKIVAVAPFIDGEIIYFITDMCVVYGFDQRKGNGNENEMLLEISLVQEGILDSIQKIVAMEYILEHESLLIALFNGDLLLLNPNSRDISSVGTLQGGLRAMALSPDGEVVALSTGKGRILLMTTDWEVLAEVDIEQETSGISGKDKAIFDSESETEVGAVQISWRGDARFFTTISHSDKNYRIRIWEREAAVLHSCAEGNLAFFGTLSWRPSGSVIASAYHDGEKGVIGSPKIVLYERNGLKRGEFELIAPKNAKVMDLLWNSDSELLGVLIRYKDWDAVQVWYRCNYHWYLKCEWRFEPEDCVRFQWHLEKPLQLLCWTVKGIFRTLNLVWETSVRSQCTSTVIDGPDLRLTPLLRGIIPPPMAARIVRFHAPIQAVCIGGEEELGSRGRGLLATALSDGCVALLSCKQRDGWEEMNDLEGYLDVSSTTEGEECVVVKSHFLKKKSSTVEFDPLSIRQIVWLSSRVLLALGKEKVEEETFYTNRPLDVLIEINIRWNDREGGNLSSLEVGKVTTVNSDVVRIIKDVDFFPCEDSTEKLGESVFVHLSSGDILQYGVDKEWAIDSPFSSSGKHNSVTYSLNSIPILSFPQNCPWLSVYPLKIPSPVCNRRQTEIVGLSLQGILYVGNQVITRDCSSFTVHSMGLSDKLGKRDEVTHHLVYTTVGGKLRTMALDGSEALKSGFEEEIQKRNYGNGNMSVKQSTEEQHGSKFRKRRPGFGEGGLGEQPVWERGAKLVASLGEGNVGVVLQTTRGNLETVYPRSLVLSATSSLLLRFEYGEAMKLVRRHRLDPNVIVDYGGWKRFVINSNNFVRQIDVLSHITDFVCSLTVKDVIENDYFGMMPPLEFELGPGNSDAGKSFGSVGGDTGGETDKWESMERDNGRGFGDGGGRDLALYEIVSKATNKVEGVCGALRLVLEREKKPSMEREKCILTTLARSNPPLLEEALVRVKGTKHIELAEDRLTREEIFLRGEREDESEGERVGQGESSNAESALRHLMWLSEADKVFNVALGLYDLPLAAMVAAQAQMDPQEVVPFLEELEKMPKSFMKATIDQRLSRWESAFRNLVEAGASHFENCMDLLKSHKELFPVAAEVMEGKGERRAKIMELWGEFLAKEERFEDAGSAFCAGATTCDVTGSKILLQRALGAYRAGGHWKSVFVLSGRLGYSVKEVSQLAVEVREELLSMGRRGEAARVGLEYLGDVEGSVGLLVDAREWVEVVRIAYAKGREDLVDNVIRPAALECARTQISQLEEASEKVSSYLSRFQTVRQKRIVLAEKVKEGESFGGGGNMAEDLESERGSEVSAMSLYTYGGGGSKVPSVISSRGTSMTGTGGKRISRKAVRKAAMGGGKIRAGSPGEEKALVEHLRSLGPSVRSKEETSQLLEILLIFGQELVAKTLQNRLKSLIKSHSSAILEAEAALAAEEEANLEENKGGLNVDKKGKSATTGGLEQNVRWKLIILDTDTAHKDSS